MPSNNSKQPRSIRGLAEEGKLWHLKTVWVFWEDIHTHTKRRCRSNCFLSELKAARVPLPGCPGGDSNERKRNAAGVPS